MAAAFPVISAGVGIASGVVGMFERRNEERRQQELVAAQIQANQNAQNMQFAAIMSGQQMLANQYTQSIALRNAQFEQNVMGLQQAAMQNTAKQAGTLAALNTQETAANVQALAGNSQAVAQESQYSRAATEAEIAALQQAGQLSAAELQAYEQLQQELEKGSAEFAGFLSRTLGNESGPVVSDATEAMANRLDRKNYADLLTKMSQATALNEQAMQQLLLSDEFGSLLEDIGQYQGNTTREQINYSLASLANQITGQRAVTEYDYRTIADAIGKSLEMEPVKNYIDQLSNNMNFMASNSQLIGQAGSIAAQNVAQNAQLLRSLPPQQSLLGGILSTVSAAAPLGSLFMNSNSGFLSNRPNVSLTQPLMTLPDVSLTRPLIPLEVQLDRPLY